MFASAIALAACAVAPQTTAPSNASAATTMGSGPEGPPGESKLSQASPTPSPSQPVANAAAAKGGSDAVLEIPPDEAQPPQAPPTPSSNQPGAEVAPDAGNAQDYANNQSSGASGPLPSYAGIADYMNQEASYEAAGTGLPMTALLPPPSFYPYYYPYFSRFYSPFYGPPIIVSGPIYAPHPPPPPPPPPPPRSRPAPYPRHGFPHSRR